jgi:hypothetical protein
VDVCYAMSGSVMSIKKSSVTRMASSRGKLRRKEGERDVRVADELEVLLLPKL